MIILALLSGLSCTSDSDDDSDILIFDNPPESQRTIGAYSPSVAAQPLIELDHYMIGIRKDPELHIMYTNISNDTVQIEIGIMWLWSEEKILETGCQHDVREPILPGQTETLVYRPLVESPSDITNYCIEVHSLLTESLPHVSLGPQVGPEEAVQINGTVGLVPLPEESARDWKALADEFSAQYNVDSRLLKAVVEAETNGRNIPGDYIDGIPQAFGYGQVWPKWHFKRIHQALLDQADLVIETTDVQELGNLILMNDNVSMATAALVVRDFWIQAGSPSNFYYEVFNTFTKLYVGPEISEQDMARRWQIWQKYLGSE